MKTGTMCSAIAASALVVVSCVEHVYGFLIPMPGEQLQVATHGSRSASGASRPRSEGTGLWRQGMSTGMNAKVRTALFVVAFVCHSTYRYKDYAVLLISLQESSAEKVQSSTDRDARILHNGSILVGS